MSDTSGDPSCRTIAFWLPAVSVMTIVIATQISSALASPAAITACAASSVNVSMAP
ncbi:MAG: hypothetical protein QM589_05460 [Thermomicrobiales bacterium]